MLRRLLCGLLVLLLSGCSAPGQTSTSAAGLTVEEYRLTANPAEALPMSPDFAAQMKPLLKKRQYWREPTQAMREQYAALQPGIPRKSRPDLGDTLLRQPHAIGSDVVHVRYDPETLDIQVVRNDAVVYTYTHPRARYVTTPDYLVQGFFIWDGRWALETVEGHLIVDGTDLNQTLGYDEIFGFHFLQGRPFYFFRQNGQVRIAYDGQVLPVHYERVPHYGCCDAAGFNPQPNGWMVRFFAVRDGQWWYVEVGKYDAE
ncbi:MAG TPA: hypothetical protein VD902_03555 [Symbiobacteriaceae bacterium]|nr:hypothetical protein [Symbiobacteriaceae bacterium]